MMLSQEAVSVNCSLRVGDVTCVSQEPATSTAKTLMDAVKVSHNKSKSRFLVLEVIFVMYK